MSSPARVLAPTPAPPEHADWPMLRGSVSDVALTAHLLAPLWTTSRAWRRLVLAAAAGTLLFVATVAYVVAKGIGVLGTTMPVAWAFPIVNFVWWVGIGHAGTFLSAFLLLLGQRWRSSINRLAEAMTLFALVNAAIFPVLHLGRPWFAYWLVPYPSTLGVWPNFKSALPWDVAAIATYLVVTVLFWYLGLIPDLAAARDRAPDRRRALIYGVFALGWSGSATEWRQRRVAYTLLAALATPLVISVHSVVSLDFATAQLPGWHSTLFPPYFVVGAIYSGLAMVLVLMLPVRAALRLHDVITESHLDRLAQVLLAIGLMLAYSYVVELFVGWYDGDRYARFVHLVDRPTGPYAWAYWLMTALNLVTPQLFWFRRFRTSVPVLFAGGLAVLLGMWLERFVIVVESLSRDFLPSSWHGYTPTWVDLGMLAGSVSLFALLFLLFVRFVPPIAVNEVKRLRFDLVTRRPPGGSA
jgi:molybdopterin-containing oxidoreductase family membrane subunit